MKPDCESVDCRPAAQILNQIGGKWTVLIVTQLGEGAMRFSDIKRMIGGISQKMLTATLRDLERDGFVKRTVTPTIPPRVDYELTELGFDLLEPLSILGAWAQRNRERVLAARAAFEAANPDAAPSRQGRLAQVQVNADRERKRAPA